MGIDDQPMNVSEDSSTHPSPTAQESVWERLKALIFLFLPSKYQAIIEKGLLKLVAMLFLVFVIVPPLVTFLAAFWLKSLANIDLPVIKELRTAYLEVINEGFSIEEVASRSNARLDYLQLFDIDFQPKRSSKDLRITLYPGQKAALDFRLVAFKADQPDCSLPEDDIELVSVMLGDQIVWTVGQDANIDFQIGKDWWKKNLNKFDPNSPIQRLTFKLTESARKLTCGRVHIEGSVRVFKDMFPGSAQEESR